MPPVIAQALSNNESVAQLISNVTAIRLDNTGEFVSRPFINGDSWNYLTLAFRLSVIGGPANPAALGAIKFFAGVCAQGKRYSESPDFCVGLEYDNASGLTAYTDANWSDTAKWYRSTGNYLQGKHILNGSALATATLNYSFDLTRNETTAASPPQDFAHAWVPYYVGIKKGSPWQIVGTNAAAKTAVNVPSENYKMSLECGGSWVGANGLIDNVMSIYNAFGGCDASAATNLTGTNPDEVTNGALNRICFYWSCATAGADLLIKDIMVVQYGV